MTKIAIVIVVFNVSKLIAKQIELINRFCDDPEYQIVVIDNSTDLKTSNEIKTIVGLNKYIKIDANCGLNYSLSHATALNQSYQILKNSFDYMVFFDHDLFPISKFSIKDVLKENVIVGLAQSRNSVHYYWAGCVFFNNSVLRGKIDFSINDNFRSDTGGNLHRIIDEYPNKCGYFEESYIGDSSIISQGDSCRFIHFRNASNWMQMENNSERIELFLNKLNVEY